MKIIIAGSRDFVDYDILHKFCKEVIEGLHAVEIVSGGAKGADCLGERYANEKDIRIKLFKADWQKFGKAAGVIRNKEMADYSDRLIVFWDGNSRGTANIIKECQKRKMPTHIFYY